MAHIRFQVSTKGLGTNFWQKSGGYLVLFLFLSFSSAQRRSNNAPQKTNKADTYITGPKSQLHSISQNHTHQLTFIKLHP